MRTTILTLFAVLAINAAVSSANLYILYDDACMDRLEYAYQKADDQSPYIMYQVSTMPGEKIILEVGAESQTPQDFMPAQFIRCNNAVFDEQLVNAINSNIDEVHMVVRKGSRYFISPINFAARLLINDNVILYDSPKYRFQFDRKLGTIGENIAYNNPRAEVFFEGKLENECSGAYLFHQYSEFDGNPHADIVLVPEVGIVEERSGINAEDALNNTLRLEKVNGRKLDRHLRRICDGDFTEDEAAPAEDAFASRAAQGDLTTKGGTPDSYGAEAYTRPRDPLANVDTTPRAVAQKPQTHKVQKGETLYRIAKNYGVTVDQVKAWNNKSSNTIYPGETLQVAASTIAAAQPQALTAKGGQAQSLPTARYSTNQPAASSKADKFHIVRAGETVASLALRYGYTEARFRQMNGLNPNEMVKVGQQIKIDHCNCPDDAPSAYQQAQPRISAMAAPAPSDNSVQAKGLVPQSYNTTAPRIPQSGSPEGETFSNDQLGSQSPEQELRNTPYFLNRSSVQSPPPASYSREQPPAYNNPDYTARGGNNPQSYDTYVPAQQQNQVRTVYIVKEGDSLFNIARTYGTSVQRLREINNLEKNEVLIPYQRIFLN
ncbi:LysM peptidoglycan-binding domain-containing protein [Phaeodactylibacter xiamenensis]|uniref:LysM peptidoglycan-binding domain-containing protein n=1 Tax=Phaeodactylibacter xiamenensis TaxID=1524460 RepID=UPI003BAA9217